MHKLQLSTLAAVAAALSFPMEAQPQGNAPGDFTIERVLTLGSVVAPTAPNFPGLVLNALQSGTIEIHQVFVYNSAQRTLEQTAFIVPGKSALPFPNLGSAPVADHYVIQVDSITTSQAHGAAVALAGHVISNDAPTPWGNIDGTEVTLTFGYQGSGSSTSFGPILESVTPLYGLYTPTGVGSLSTNASVQKCSLGSLNGVYAFQLNGYVQTGAATFMPYVESGHFTADGNGNVSVVSTHNAGGAVSPNVFSLTYVVNDDCTASFKWKGASMDVMLSNNGQHLRMIFSSPSAVVAMGEGQAQ